MDGSSRSWQPTPRAIDSGYGERMTSHNDQRNPNFTSKPPHNDEFKVYVKNVPADMTKESLEVLFRNYGTVVSTHVLDPKEGRNSTIAFVRYTSDEEVGNAIESLNGTQLGQSYLVVEKAVQRERVWNQKRNQEPENRTRDFQNGTGNWKEQPSFQGYRPQNDWPQREYTSSQQTFSRSEMSNYHVSMGGRQEEAVFNPRGPGRGGYLNEQPSFARYQTQSYNAQSLRVGNMGHQTNYNQQIVNDGRMANSYPGIGITHEQAVFNPRGPGRGGIQDDQLFYQQPMSTGNLEQQMYRQSSEMINPQAAMGVRCEEAVFNPKGPGRGGGIINQPAPSYAPGRNSSYMNGTSNDYSYHKSSVQSQENPTSRMSDNDQQHAALNSVNFQQEMDVTGRLPYVASPQDTPQMTNGAQHCHRSGETGHFARECPRQMRGQRRGDQTCYKCGEVGHMARECTSSGGLDNTCHKCGEEGHFAKECPVVASASSSPDKGRAGKVPPVTYIPPELPGNIDELFQDAPHSGLNFDKYDAIPVKVTGKDIPPAISTFEEAGILEQCASNIKRAQFTKPTPIQKHAIPITLAGRDLMACAQTGSGKTVAYLVPVLTGMITQGLLSGGGYLSGETQSPAALCLAPTRELAVQIHKEVCKFAHETLINARVCYGGVSVQHQIDKIRRGCHFLIATPGRLIDFVDRERVSLASVRYLILDEADRMLDMGFENDVRKIVERLGMPDKTHRQTLMFSATFPDEIQRLAADFLKENYLFVAVGTIGGSNLDIVQTVISVPGDNKQERLFDILLNSGTDRTLIFVELKRVADFLACLLSQNNFPTTSISGDRTQQEREAALRDFRSGRAPVLVATSVAARGLDIPDVKHVINFDLPQDIEEYVHRIGRTGRIGNAGKATSFFQPGKDERLARSLVKVLSQAFQVVPEWLEQVAEEAVGSSYGPAGGKFASKDRREREHPRASAHVQPRMSGPVVNGLSDKMELLTVQPRSNSDEEEWD